MIQRIKRAVRRLPFSTVVMILVFVLLGGTIVAGFMVLINDRRELIRTNQALIEQVRDTGEKPVVDSPNEVVQGQAGATGATGARGERGPVGPRGEMGERGQQGSAGARGERGEDGTDGADGATGASGADGADSTVPGPVGAAGADSTVAGPVGPAGPIGPAGPAGAAGKDGTNGADGKPGADGRSVSSVACVMDGTGTYVVFYDQSGVEVGRVSTVCAPAA